MLFIRQITTNVNFKYNYNVNNNKFEIQYKLFFNYKKEYIG